MFRLIFNKFLYFRRVLNFYSCGIGKTSVNKIYEYMIDNACDLETALNESIIFLSERIYEKVLLFVEKLNELRMLIFKIPIDKFFSHLMSEFNYLEKINEDKSLNYLYVYPLLKENVNTLLTADDKRQVLINILDSLTLNEDKNISKTKVILSSIHSVKGLEFDEVFLVGYEDEFIPGSFNKHLSPEEIEVDAIAWTHYQIEKLTNIKTKIPDVISAKVMEKRY